MNRSLEVALRLGRVSNLPTVWTNVLCGVLLNGGVPRLGLIVPLAVALSLFYVAGMYLNDAFDRQWDARHRPERPIPSGDVSVGTVFLAGFGMLAFGLLILGFGPGGGRALASGLVLAALILVYDVGHKKNPLLAAAIMGACRVTVYVTSALAAEPRLTLSLCLGALALLVYLMVLSLIARHETRSSGLPRLVGQLIAGIALLDGSLLLLGGHFLATAACVAAFFFTRRLQRRVAGT